MLRKIFLQGAVLALILVSPSLFAQTQQLFTSQQFRMGERIIRIAEVGELADSVNVWGDVGSAGRYIIPKGTTISQLLSYSFGPRTISETQTQVDWSKMRVEINVQEYDPENGVETINEFRYRFEEPMPAGMSEFKLQNNQTIAVRVKRKPGFRDYVNVIAPVLTSIATTIVIVDRLSGN